VTEIISFKSATAGFPPRPGNLAEEMPLVIVFAREPDLLPFVRYLFNDHSIVTVADWDLASPRLLDMFGLSEPLKDAFRRRIGRPMRTGLSDAKVVALRPAQPAA